MKASPFCSPLRYPGGKNCIFKFVSNLFYENSMVGASYAEPYAGGAGLALRLLFSEHVNHIYINDLDRSIYSFWKAVLENSVEFCQWIETVPVDVLTWRYYKDIQNNSSDVDYLELAKSTFYLNRTNISGVIKGGIIGGYKQKGKYKIDARFNKLDLINRIKKIASFRDRITISNYDGVDFIKNIDKKKQEIFIYLDPPYYQKGANLYMNSYNKEDHTKLAKFVGGLNKKWMVSYDNHDFILNLYAEHKKITYRLSQSTSNRVGDEILVFSPRMYAEQSIFRLNSPKYI